MYTDSQASLLPPTKVLRLDNPDFDLGVDIGVQTDRDAIDAESADRLVEIDLTLFNVVALGFELVSYVRRRHRAEQFAFFTDARREGQGHLLEFGRLFGGGAAAGLFSLFEPLTLLLDPLAVAGGGLVSEASGQQIVEGVP